MDAMSKFADAEYITAGKIVGGAFTTSLSATPDLLKSGTAYSVYTWQAHSHSNTSQDTETPVTIDWSKLAVAPPAPGATKAATTASARSPRSRPPPRAAAGGHPEVERWQACRQGHRQADQQGQEGGHQVGQGQQRQGRRQAAEAEGRQLEGHGRLRRVRRLQVGQGGRHGLNKGKKAKKK